MTGRSKRFGAVPGRRRNRDNWHFPIRDRQWSQFRVGILTFGPPRGWARRHELTVDRIIAPPFGAWRLERPVDYEIGSAGPHNFRFATRVVLVTLLTLP